MVMFYPWEVQEWRRLVPTNAALRLKHRGYHLGRANVEIGTLPDTQNLPTKRGDLIRPDRIYGDPYDAACLDGVQASPIYAEQTERICLKSARVIGRGAVLSEDGYLFAPRDARYANRERLLAHALHGAQGFLLEEGSDRMTIYFTQRPVPAFHDVHALFFPNVEANNYGSFMFRQLPQMIQAASEGLAYECYIVSERTSFFFETLKLFNLPTLPIYTTQEISGDIFKSVTFYAYDDAEGFIGEDTLSKIQEVSDSVVRTCGKIDSHENIYVSRSLSAMRHPLYRVMRNESEVERIVSSAGFKPICPETLSLTDQIRLFHDAERVIGPSGSGMFNLAFAQNPARVIDIESYHVTVRQHAKFYSSLGSEYCFLFSRLSEEDDLSADVRSYTCPVATLREALEWSTQP